MKKAALFLILALFIPLSSPVFSQEEKEKDTTITPTATDDKIEELKEKVAARVSELKKGKTNGLFGLVKSATDEAFILIVNESEYSIQLDEDAKVYSIDTSLRKKAIKMSAFEKGASVSIIGVVNDDEKTAVASVVVTRTPNIFIAGNVDEVSTKDGTITVSDLDGNTHIVNIEVSTKINNYDLKKDAQAKIGLSSIEQNSNILVYAVKEEETLNALRILILPDSFEASPTKEEEPTTTPAKATPTPKE